MIGDHDFIKLSLTSVAYLLHELPKLDDSEESPKVGEWYTRQVYYRLKSMVTEGSSGIHCAAEPSEVTTQQFEKLLAYMSLCIYRWGPEHKVDNLSVQKSYISLF